MPKMDILNMSGEKVSELELADSIFAIDNCLIDQSIFHTLRAELVISGIRKIKDQFLTELPKILD